MKFNTKYEYGANRLLSLLGKEHKKYMDVLNLKEKLSKNLILSSSTRNSNDLRVDRMRLIEELNLISKDSIGVDFFDLVKPGFHLKEESIIESVYQTFDYAARVPELISFYGRENEISKVIQYINEESKLICVLGMPGIGKTTLVTRIVQEIGNNFNYILWHSLINALPLDELLKESIDILSKHTEVITFEESITNLIERFIHYLRKEKCLIVLDNYESLFRVGEKVGEYLDGFEKYSEFLNQLGGINHQSCVLITSREKPKEFDLLETDNSPVKSIIIQKLPISDGIQILKDKHLSGKDEELAEVVNKYSGNPLALKLISETIYEVFLGDISEFLRNTSSVLIELYDLLDDQFARLTQYEQEIAYWLAIERESVSISELRKNTSYLMAEKHLIYAIKSLQRRSLVEITGNGFTLANVVMEFVTDKLINLAISEIQAGKLQILVNHALMKAETKEHIRGSQVRLILSPVVSSLGNMMNLQAIESKLARIISALRIYEKEKSSCYATGNIINLCIELNIALDGKDFSNLPIWQAYLKKTTLRGTNFKECDFWKTSFIDTFGQILSVKFSNSGNFLIASSANGEILVWRLDTLMRFGTYKGHKDWIRSISINPGDTIIASGSDDNSVILWDINENSQKIKLVGHQGWVLSTVFFHDGKGLITGDTNGELRIWDTRTGNCLKIIKGHTNWIRALDISDDGKYLVSGSEDLSLKIWDTTNWKLVKSIDVFSGNITGAKFCQDNKNIIVSCYDSLVLVNIESGTIIIRFEGHTHRIFDVDYHAESDSIASCGQDNTIRIWDVNTGICKNILQGHTSTVQSICFNSQGDLLVSGSEDQSVRLWETESGKCISILKGYTNWIKSVAIDVETDSFISCTEDGIVRIWDIFNGHLKKKILNASSVSPIAIKEKSRTIYFSSFDHNIIEWDMQKGQETRRFVGHTNRVRTLSISGDGSILASGGESNKIRLWDLHNGEQISILSEHDSWIRSISFDHNVPAEKFFSASEDKTIKFWNIKNRQCIRTINTANYIWAIKVHPNHEWLIAGGEDCKIHFWNIKTGELGASLSGHRAAIYSLALNKSGNLLFSGGFDNLIKIWDLNSGKCIGNLNGHESWVWGLDINPQGNKLISGSADGTIRIWDIDNKTSEHVIQIDRPYERMNITSCKGLENAQMEVLKELGAITEF